MIEYYFLFVIAFIFTFFASVQDLRKREVANWINFSLIIFTLAYRAFYSIINKNFQFFLFGIIGFVIFFIFAHLLYYGKAFAGGDAKLLMGFGIILPYSDFESFIFLPLFFIFLLFLIGAVYSMSYSVIIVGRNKQRFKKEFLHYLERYKFIVSISLLLFVFSLFLLKFYPFVISLSVLLIIPVLFMYTKSLEKCMIRVYKYNELSEGDWIVNNIKLTKNIIIKKTVHGLTMKDIKLLRKYKRNILVKEGIHFVPAFLIHLIFMGIIYYFGLNFGLLNIFNLI